MGNAYSPDADVVIAGAGLAGLAAAVTLHEAGLRVLVLEAGPEPGGRVRTDVVAGFRLDHGFQVLNPAYPAVRDLVDVDALRPGRFWRALRIVDGDRSRLLGNPLDSARALRDLWPPGAIRARDLPALAALSARDLAVAGGTLTGATDRPTHAELRRRGLSEEIVDGVLRPFLAGVFLEAELETSARFFHLVWRTFLRGTPVLPAAGMGALPAQLASRLPAGSVRCDTPVREVTAGATPRVRTDDGPVRAGAVVVATDGTVAARLLPGIAEPAWKQVTTRYFGTGQAPLDEPVIVVDARGGPVVNTSVLSAVAPSYAPADAALVSASTLDPDADERSIREHLAALYRTSARDWELLGTYRVPRALPAMPAPHPVRKPVRHSPGVYVCGDHRDTSSIQGALVSGRRAASAAIAGLH
ncbi:oxidoreductase [Amycolatopsis antarctica]|uniref:Oxidoreductase n=1 Tax=Amycolatopsis antarctica TaxID=1854586 RepID=A0A263CZG8_9PSEU|nr:NAD(P)/FAD-dependent oxidoreductase [Amycolatopsis antarctica]OZM71564.1 oxidoreductase [Amycolatopsis antarctica]